MLKNSAGKVATDESTGGVALLTRPPQAAKTACSPSGLRWGCFWGENAAREKARFGALGLDGW